VVWEVERWVTPDHGRTWRSQTLTRGSKHRTKNLRPITVYGHRGGELQVLWMRGHYWYWTNYRTALVGWPMASAPAAAAGGVKILRFDVRALEWGD
jgi:hypothetical protein